MAIITRYLESDVDTLTRNLLQKLKARNAEIATELDRNREAIVVLERRLNLQPSESQPPFVMATSKPALNGSSQSTPELSFRPQTFFGLKQKQAAIKLLRVMAQPMTINQIIETLKRSGFSFKAQSPYRVLWATLTQAEEIQKQGSLFGLKEWKETSRTQPPVTMPVDETVDFGQSNDEPESVEHAEH